MRPPRPFAFVLLALAAPTVAQSGWVQRFPPNSPPLRAWHGLVFDPLRGVHVLFGGFSLFVEHGDTWEWNGLQWLQRIPVNAPSARSGHAMAYDLLRGRIVLFGGRAGQVLGLGDTWEFDGVNWTQRSPQQSPLARYDTGAAFSAARGRVIMFSGMSGVLGPFLQDTWEWDGTNWAQLAPAHAPSTRRSFGMTSDMVRGLVLVSGGVSSGTNLSDAWAFDGVDWTPLPATQSPPAARGTAMTDVPAQGMNVQFGGQLATGTSNETWLHDGSDWRPDVRAAPLAPRVGMSLSYDLLRDRVVLFGGYSVSALGPYLDETWEYDLAGVATWSVAGAGCAGTQGVPELRPAGPQRAILGANYALAVSGGVTFGALFGLGFSNTSWNGNPLPLSLAGYGMPGCDLHTSLDVVSFAAGVGGTAQITLAMPNDPSLVGVRFFAQALVPQPGANPLGAVMSNAVTNVVGSF